MPSPRVCVLRAPGTNCDVETAYAFDAAGGRAERVHLFRLLERPDRLDDFQILCLPGGFSYGDDLGAGVIFAEHLRGPLADAFGRFLAAGKLVLGVCNGFQVLLKAGVLPGGPDGRADADRTPEATLTWNTNGRYTCRWVRLAVTRPDHAFLRGLNDLELPVAHAEGRVAVRDDAVVDRWRADGRIALAYVPTDGPPPDDPTADLLSAPANPGGSIANIAGLSDPSGRILGLMPHPERFLFAHQHPRWTRLGLEGEGMGMRLFRNAVEYFA